MRKLGDAARFGRACAFQGLAALAMMACREPAPSIAFGPIATPTPRDHGDLCLDVGDVRACWDRAPAAPGCVAGRCLVARTVPAGVPSALGFRCSGRGAARTCDDRGRHAGPFTCDAARCVQRRPRTPDAGEWECIEQDGVHWCRGVASAAGVPELPNDPAFVCGERPGGERVCVDLAPDPAPLREAARCKVSYAEGAPARVCTMGRAPRVGGSCGRLADCPRDALCVAGWCLPARPAPACWLDADCGTGARCRWGSCVGHG